MNIERGDTFAVMDDRYRGIHFTCVGVEKRSFYAGDTEGRMWSFEQTPEQNYRVYRMTDVHNQNSGWISAEAIRKE